MRYLLNENGTTNLEDRIITFEALKKSVLASKKIATIITVTGATYYVDATNGLDTNDGLTELTAWQTWQHAIGEPYTVNDALLFKRGEDYPVRYWDGDSWMPGYSVEIGSNMNGVTIGSYGTSELQPHFYSMEEHIGYTYVETAVGSNIWERPLGIELGRLYEDGAELILSVDMDGSEPLSRYFRWSKETPDVLTLYSETDPNLNVYSSSYSDRLIKLIDGLDGLTIYDLKMSGGYRCSVELGEISNIHFENATLGGAGNYAGISTAGTINSISNITGTNLEFDADYELFYWGVMTNTDSRGGGDGLEFRTGDNFSFTDSYYRNWGHSCFAVSVADDGTNEANNIILENNFSESPDIAYGGRMGCSGGGYNLSMSNNYMKKIRVRAQLQAVDSHFDNNIFDRATATTFKDVTAGQGINISVYTDMHTTGCTYNNNVMFQCSGYGFWSTIAEEDKFYDCEVIGNQLIDCWFDEDKDGRSSQIGLRLNRNLLQPQLLIQNNNVYNRRGTDGNPPELNYSVDYDNYTATDFNALYPEYSGNTSIAPEPTKHVESTTGSATHLNGVDQSILITSIPNTIGGTFLFSIKADSYTDLYIAGRSENYRWIRIHQNEIEVSFNTGIYHIDADLDFVNGEAYDIAVRTDGISVALFVDGDRQLDGALDTEGGTVSSFDSIGKVHDNYGNLTLSGYYQMKIALKDCDIKIHHEYKEEFFSHCNPSDPFVSDKVFFSADDVGVNMPLNKAGSTRHDYISGNDYAVINYTAGCDVVGTNFGVQNIYFNDNMTKASGMAFRSGQVPQIVEAVPTTPYSIKDAADGVVYIYTDDKAGNRTLTIDGVVQPTPAEIVGNIVMTELALDGVTAVTSREYIETYDGILETT